MKECQPLHHNNRTEEGYRERIALLSRHLPDAVSFVELVLREHLRKVVRRDDVVDALVGLVTARLSRGDLRTLPETPELDPRGMPMEMVYVLPGGDAGGLPRPSQK